MEWSQANEIAQDILSRIRPRCIRAEAAGSVRRQKANVKDIEIVFITKLVEVPVGLGLFTEQVQGIELALQELVEERVLSWDNRLKRHGERYKRLLHNDSGIVIELFGTEPDRWGLIYSLRTGPGDFNQMLVTKRKHGGAMPAGMAMAGGQLYRHSTPLLSRSEEEHFAHIGVPCWPPQERTVERLRAWLWENR